VHEEPDDPLRLRREVRLVRRKRACRLLLLRLVGAQQIREGEQAKAAAGAGEELAPRAVRGALGRRREQSGDAKHWRISSRPCGVNSRVSTVELEPTPRERPVRTRLRREPVGESQGLRPTRVPPRPPVRGVRTGSEYSFVVLPLSRPQD